MKEQMIRASITDDKIDAEIHADSMVDAIEMLAELAEAICVQAEKAKLVPNKNVCGTLIGYAIGKRYMTEEAAAMLEEALKSVEGVSEWVS